MEHQNHHHRKHRRDAKPEPVAKTTVVSVVYVTVPPTFTGAIAGFTTLGPAESLTTYYVYATVDSELQSWLTTETIGVAPTSSASIAGTITAAVSDSVISGPGTTVAQSQTSVLIAQSSLHTTTSSPTPSESTASETASSTTSAIAVADSSSSGMSSSVTAVISLIAIAGFIALFAGIFICVRRRNANKQLQAMQEKGGHANGNIPPSTRSLTSVTAPQIKIRPITQFSPGFGNFEGTGDASNQSEKIEINHENPFGTHAAAMSNEDNSANPFGNHAATANGITVLEDAAIAGAAVAGATESAASSVSKDLPNPLKPNKSGNIENRGPPSPVVSVSSNTSNMAVNGAGRSPSSTDAVHRVQIDFHPSMEDEIELAAGDLVRLLNAYDDGWCLVIRLNHGKRGVCPRSCLSNRPIKPRPRPGASAPAGRSMTPSHGRAMTPIQGPAPTAPPATQLPMAPGQARPMTPGSGGLPSPGMAGFHAQRPAASRDPRSMTPTVIQAPTTTVTSMSASSEDDRVIRRRSGSFVLIATGGMVEQSSTVPSKLTAQEELSSSVESSNIEPISPPNLPFQTSAPSEFSSQIPVRVARKPVAGQDS